MWTLVLCPGIERWPFHGELAVLVTGPPGTFWWKETSKCPVAHSPGFLGVCGFDLVLCTLMLPSNT